MTGEEAKRFLKGEGCPSCDFGKKVSEDVQKEAVEEEFLRTLTEETLLKSFNTTLVRLKPI